MDSKENTDLLELQQKIDGQHYKHWMTSFLFAILLCAAGFDSHAFLLIKLVRYFAAILLDFPHNLLFFIF